MLGTFQDPRAKKGDRKRFKTMVSGQIGRREF